MSVFTTRVQSIGSEAELFKKEEMVILFGKDAPDALADYCHNVEVQPAMEVIMDEQVLVIDEQICQITAVSEVILTNLDTLGHITTKFSGTTIPELPGTLYAEERAILEMTVGTAATIL